MVEVLVAAGAEAVAGHVHGAAEAPVVEAAGELRALVGGQQRRGEREALRVELLAHGREVEVGGHGRPTPAGRPA